MKIGLYGGSFDPVHQGHIAVARSALKALNLDEIWFLPAMLNPFKDHSSAGFKQRCEMVKMAIKPYRHFRMSDIEKENGIPSYTINTVRRIRARYPGNEYYWIIGSDSLEKLDGWKNIDELRTLVRFICVSRDEMTRDDVIMVKVPWHPASSTAIRNGDFRYIDRQQARYIMDNGLYCESISRNKLTEKRWKHVESVAQLCVRFAQGNNLDTRKAYLAGIYHDIAKYFDHDEMSLWMDLYYPQQKQLGFDTWHQFAGEAYLYRYCQMRDKEILKAIRHHCLGDDDAPLSMMLYCADKLDPTRGYDSSKEIELCCRDIKQGYRTVYLQQQEYLRKEGII